MKDYLETKLSIFCDNLHDFEYIKTEGKKFYTHSLFYSHAEHWQDHIKGQLIFEIKEDKEDSKLSFPSVSSFSLCEAEYFDILLRLVLRDPMGLKDGVCEPDMPRVIEISKREKL